MSKEHMKSEGGGRERKEKERIQRKEEEQGKGKTERQSFNRGTLEGFQTFEDCICNETTYPL